MVQHLTGQVAALLVIRCAELITIHAGAYSVPFFSPTARPRPAVSKRHSTTRSSNPVWVTVYPTQPAASPDGS